MPQIDGGAAAANPQRLPMAGERYSYDARRRRHRQPVIFPHDVTAPVAQLDRAPDYESGGQEFESLRARQNTRHTVRIARH